VIEKDLSALEAQRRIKAVRGRTVRPDRRRR
jgi:hypothetical protein